jgi:hypothetical protein
VIPTDNHSSRGGERVRLVVLHTTEGARDVDSLGAFFQSVTNVSYHAAFDDERLETYVAYSEAAYSIRNGNPMSDNGAFCAFSAWSRGEWLNHPRMVELSAQWVAERCVARGLPIRRLSVPETADAVRDRNHPGGVIMHRDYTFATGDGTHTDCGDGLPWDVIITRAQQIAGGGPGSVAVGSTRRRDEDNNMELPITTTRRDYQVPTDVVGGWCGDAQFMLTANTDGNTKSARVFGIYAVIWRGGTPPDVRELQRNDAGAAFSQWWPWKGPLPDGTTSVIVSYLAPQGMVARVEYEH